jgi:hypothetical protein
MLVLRKLRKKSATALFLLLNPLSGGKGKDKVSMVFSEQVKVYLHFKQILIVIQDSLHLQ